MPTEASAQAVRVFRGVSGRSTSAGHRSLELSPLAAQTWYLDVLATVEAVGRLARAVAEAPSLELADDALHAPGCAPSSTWSARRRRRGRSGPVAGPDRAAPFRA